MVIWIICHVTGYSKLFIQRHFEGQHMVTGVRGHATDSQKSSQGQDELAMCLSKLCFDSSSTPLIPSIIDSFNLQQVGQ